MIYQKNHSFDQVMAEKVTNAFRRFGRFGPVYQVMGMSRKTEQGDLLMKIHVLETKEELEYPFASILRDPQENNLHVCDSI